MSTDYNVTCPTCKKVRHLGQRMASYYSFGWGTPNTSEKVQDQADTMEWIAHHVGHCPAGLIVQNSDVDYPDDYEYVHDEKVEE